MDRLRIKIFVDSTADMAPEWFEKLDADMVPLKVIWPDGTEENDTRDPADLMKFYEKISNASELPKTSQPTVFEFLQKYRNAEQSGYEGIVVLTLSSKMSGTANSAATAAKEAKIPVEIFDTKLASSVIPLVARRARELAEKGLDPKKIVEQLEKDRKNNKFQAIFYVSDFSFLVKGGRVSKIQGFFGTVLKFKVGVWINEEGEMIPFGRARGRSHAYDMLIEQSGKYIPFGSNVMICMIHANAENDAKELLERLKEKYKVLDASFHMTGKVITTHVGPGMCGFGIEAM
ncbi:DegV family protein [Athalassotoga sp.]|uniref:DegV family protein n=1 Tax=Athalassotoga sp. TaxID=2022597 RepID=UPI003CFD7AFF